MPKRFDTVLRKHSVVCSLRSSMVHLHRMWLRHVVAQSVLTLVLVAFGLLGFTPEASATYPAAGTLVSTNLLAGEDVALITSFGYHVSSLPAGTGLRVRFSQDGTQWYDAAGTAGAWETMAAGTQTIDLSGLGWSGDSFSYQMEFTSDGSATPVLESITVAWHSSGSAEDIPFFPLWAVPVLLGVGLWLLRREQIRG
jgi:hypothetical protein